MRESLIQFVQEQYRSRGPIPLHAPVFAGNEKAYLADAIDSTFVSSVGPYVDRFEREISLYTASPSAVATMNGTAALHVALKLAGVACGDYVITQPLTFVATCNAIVYCGAEPLFLDVDIETLSLSTAAVGAWLDENAFIGDDGICRTKGDGRSIKACVPMHTFGHPADLDGLVDVCKRWNIVLVEDAAESLGSQYKGRHTGTVGALGVLSFNGNKIITTGGGGMILSAKHLGARAKYLTTTAKRPHSFEFFHEEVGYNYRLPNINAALGCAQLERLEEYIRLKRDLAFRYAEHLKSSDLTFINEPDGCRSNFWLVAVLCEDRQHRDELLRVTNQSGIMTRPIWTLMNNLPMYARCPTGPLANASWLEDRVVNLPSSVVPS